MYNNPLPLTQAEYESLLPERRIFDLYGAGVFDLPNPSRDWITNVQKIYSRCYNTGLININCPACRLDGVKGIYPLFKAYDDKAKLIIETTTNEQRTNPAESTISTNKNGATKTIGRKPKQWS